MDRFMEEKLPLPVAVAPPPTHRIEVDGEIDLDRLEMFGGRVHPHHIPEVVWSVAESNSPRQDVVCHNLQTRFIPRLTTRLTPKDGSGCNNKTHKTVKKKQKSKPA